MEIEKNVFLVDKPLGVSSFDIIRHLRKLWNIKKMGHGGTLDPGASGLMIIATNEATKRLADFLKLPKTYEAEITLGLLTDSGDIHGKVLEQLELNKKGGFGKKAPFEKDLIEKELASFVGKHDFTVPIFSAIKRDGKPLYEYARAGEKVELPVKTMEIMSAKLLDYNFPKIKVEFHVSSGTYIRTLAEEFGKILGVPATLSGLRRTVIGEWKIADALKLENVKSSIIEKIAEKGAEKI